MSDYSDGYPEDSDADDEYERSVASPTLPADYPLSPSESDGPLSNQQTPTHGRGGLGLPSPGIPIDRWTTDQCADYVAGLGLEQYADTFIYEEVNGEALVSMQHEDLKDMGVSSLGHRLTILKSVYDVKLSQHVPIEPDHYVPLSADANAPDAHATQDDVARIINQIKLRDERLLAAEEELRILKEDLNRVWDDSRRLREDVLPVLRVAKDKHQPLPTPEAGFHSDTLPSPADSKPITAIPRKLSTRKLQPARDQKLPSPTINEPTTSLDASAAAKAATSQLTASMSSQGSQNSPRLNSQPSPTSPPFNSILRGNGPPSSRFAQPTSDENWPYGTAGNSTTNLADRSQANNANSTRRLQASHAASTPNLTSDEFNPSQFRNTPARTPQPTSATPDGAGAGAGAASTNTGATTTGGAAGGGGGTGGGGGGGGGGAMDFMKSFRVSMDEPCHKVLPVALKKYQIQDDWRQYSLYIVHGDQERCLGLNERPLILFKQLASEGKKPMFMLRKHAAPAVGFDHTRAGAGDSPASAGPPSAFPSNASVFGGASTPNLMPGSSSRQSYAESVKLPGGVF